MIKFICFSSNNAYNKKLIIKFRLTQHFFYYKLIKINSELLILLIIEIEREKSDKKMTFDNVKSIIIICKLLILKNSCLNVNDKHQTICIHS